MFGTLSASKLITNTGSTARDRCMLERNILSHIKLGLLLSLLSASILLHARLSGSNESGSVPGPRHSLPSYFPIALVLALSALLALLAGTWEYWSSDRDMRTRHAFMVASKPHIAAMSMVSGIVFSLCLVFLVDNTIA
ncbi:hypothetical protein ACEPAG_5385 [Sanghuangporus baumii]